MKILTSIAILLLILCGYWYFHLLGMRTADDLSVEVSPAPDLSSQDNVLNQDLDSANKLSNASESVAEEEIDCEKYNVEEEMNLSEQRHAYFSSLKYSDDYDEKLIHVIFSGYKDDAEKISKLSALAQSEKALFAHELMRLCIEYNDNALCTDELIEGLTQEHRDDSQIWQQAMLYYAKTNQDSMVINAIEQSIQSKYTSSTFSEMIDVYAQSLEKAGVGNYLSNSFVGAQLAGMRSPDYRNITDWCKKNIEYQVYAQACLEVGQQLEQFGPTLMDKIIGLAIQEIVYKLEDNVKSQLLVSNRIKELKIKMASPEFFAMTNSIFSNETLLRNYISSFTSLGEIEAAESLKEEIGDYHRSDQYLRCGNLF